MDGQNPRLRTISELLALCVVGLGLAFSAPAARAQAMTKAAVDFVPHETLASVPAAAVLPAAATPAAATVTAPVAATTLVPAVKAAPTVVSAAESAPEKSPDKSPEKPADTEKPATGATAVVTTQPTEATTKPAETATTKSIENTPIRPAASKSDAPAAGSDAKTGERSGGMLGGLYSSLQVGGALAIVLGLILIGRAVMRKFVPGAVVSNGKGVMETLARYSIGRNQTVVLLRIGSQIVALNQTKDASQSILVIDEPVEVARIIGQIEGQDPNSIQANFNRVLSNARMDLETPDTMDVLEANKSITTQGDEDLDAQLEEMAAAKRQLMELRAQVRSVRDHLPT